MELYPAIDLRGGRCVRLYQGDFDKETAYGTDPVTVAKELAAAGARWVHVVDLDAARTGSLENLDVVAAITRAVGSVLALQAGGGVRDAVAFERLRGAGVARVVLGTAAVENPDLVAELAAQHRVAVALDRRGERLVVRGWATPGPPLAEVLAGLEGAGVEAVVVTDVERDGTLSGPDFDGLADVLDRTALQVIASGGVGTLADLEGLASLQSGGRRLAGAIVGRALYEGRFSVEEALAACEQSA